MNDLETEAAPVLSGMMDGREVTMWRDAQSLVATWVLKTAMMVEFMTPARQFAPEDRAYVRVHRQVPNGHTIFLAAYFGSDAARGMLSYAPLRFAGHLGETTLSATTFAIDHLVCQVIGSGKVGGFVIDVEHPAADLEAVIQLWPSLSDPVSWPPRFILDDRQLDAFINMVLPPDD